MYNGKDPRRNCSGYMDMTAYAAISNIDREARMRFKKLLNTIFYICDLAGFEIIGRIELKDKKTGRIWK